MMLNLLTEPINEGYHELIEICLKYCKYFLLITHKRSNVTSNATKLLDVLNKFLIEKSEKSEWPGTKLLNKKAMINCYSFNNESKKILLKFSNSLFSWQQPNLPEDLCFLGDNKNAILTTISHERDAFIKATESIEEEFKNFFTRANIEFEYVNSS